MKNKLVLIVLFFVIFPTYIFADSGPKPSIEVKVENINTTNYVLDLFVLDATGLNYSEEANYNGAGLSDEQIEKLHSLNFDGWISESTRWGPYLLMSQCGGNSNYKNYFGYFGTPKIYKIVIINYDTNDIKISDVIKRKDFNSQVTIDYNNMKVVSKNNSIKTIIKGLVVLLLTVGIELLIALLFKIKDYKTIAIANLITNIWLQILLLVFVYHYFPALFFGEIIVIITELIVYLFKIKDVSKKKIVIYCLIANLLTALCTFFI